MAKSRYANGRNSGRIPVIRKRYTAQFKEGIVQEILKEKETIGRIASEQESIRTSSTVGKQLRWQNCQTDREMGLYQFAVR